MGFVRHVIRRVTLILFVFAVGLLSWPGDVGAQGIMNSGNIDSSGARRIRLPQAESPADAKKGGAGAVLAMITSLFGGSDDDDSGEQAAPTPENAAPSAALLAEFGAPEPSRTPYEASHAAVTAAR